MNTLEKLETWCNMYNIQFKTDYECPYEGEYYQAVAWVPEYPHGKVWAYVTESNETFLNLSRKEEGWNAIEVPTNWDPSSPDYIPQWLS